MSIESYYSVNKTPFLIEGNDKTIARGNIALAYAKPSHTSMSYQIVRAAVKVTRLRIFFEFRVGTKIH